MKQMTKTELQARNREIQNRMSELNDKVYNEKREMTADEKIEWNALSREKLLNEGNLRDMLTDAELEKYREHKSKGEMLREILSQASQSGQKREITLFSTGVSDKHNITASGAIELDIKDIIPTLHEGLGLPSSLKIVSGVTGNEVWPVSTNDVEMEEVGEVAQLSDKVLNFEKISPVQHRVGLKVPVSNMAIDNAAFDLMAFVQTKFTLALRKYLAQKVYSQAQWSGNKGPFSGLSSSGTINLGTDAYKNILTAVAAFSDKGFYEGNVCLVMDAETEAQLKATPKLAGAAAGFVVENGTCAGYPYVVTHYLNTKLNGGGTALEPTSDKSLGIGYFEWLAVQQHGTVRMTVDPITLADKNVTRVIINSAYSMTDLSKYINGADGTATQAFARYVVEGDESAGF